MAEPLFKWTGGKRRLFNKYNDLNFFPHPDEFEYFVDLFFGAGSVTCWVHNLMPDKKLIINDLNSELMLVYTQMRDNWQEFKDEYLKLVELFLGTPQSERKELYNRHRDIYCFDYKQLSRAGEAAMLLVMMKINFNGIWKVYKKFGGRYSTCPGNVNYKESVFDIQKVEMFREMLLRAELYNLPFDCVPIPNNAWVYADPPYRDQNHQMYSDVFGDELQDKLVHHLKLHAKLYALSNKEIGDNFWSDRFDPDLINFLDHKYTCGNAGAINPVTEVLIKNYGEVLAPVTLDAF